MINAEHLLHTFQKIYTETPSIIVRAPGRINLIGEHVDYNEGWVLPVALDRSAWIAASPNISNLLSVSALDLNERVNLRVDRLKNKRDADGEALPSWAHYPAGVAWALQEAGLPVGGMKAVLTSDIPIGAGLSSSAAIEVAFGLAWQALADWEIDRLTLARICQNAENAYVGVNCGLMDQFASLHGVRGSALLFDCRTLEWEAVRLPQDVTPVIADSGVRHTLGTSAYNERRAACEQAVSILAKHLPGVRALRDVSIEAFAQHADLLPTLIRRRAEHVVYECERTLRAADRLRSGEVKTFGELMFEGHKSLRDLYQVSCQELDTLVAIAAELPGCYGARLTGAGFGGCTVNLVDTEHAEYFSRALSSAYSESTGREATIWICDVGEGAEVQRL
jgi:galactokinase